MPEEKVKFGVAGRKTEHIYSVMQSDGNSFCVYLVMDSFYMSYRDEIKHFRPDK